MEDMEQGVSIKKDLVMTTAQVPGTMTVKILIGIP